MSRFDKLLFTILSGRNDSDVSFADLRKVLEIFGFEYRVKGDHFIYFHENIGEIINIQPIGSKSKPYQVKQVRNILVKYGFGGK